MTELSRRDFLAGFVAALAAALLPLTRFGQRLGKLLRWVYEAKRREVYATYKSIDQIFKERYPGAGLEALLYADRPFFALLPKVSL